MPKRLDPIDRKILRILEDEGRISNEILAKRTGLNEIQCEERIFKLELDGHIGGYTIIRNYPNAGDRPISAIIIIAMESGRTLHDLHRSMESIPEILTAEVLEKDRTVLMRVEAPHHNRISEITTFLRNQSSVASLEVSTTQPLFNHRPVPQAIGY